MIIALRAILVLGGLLLGFIGFGFFMDPAASGADFGISPGGASEAHGLTSIRADFTAFFVVGGASLIWGALAKRGDALVIGGALMLVTLFGRVVSLSIHGSFDGFLPPMAVEAVLGIAALIGARVLPRA
ncbi:MAG: hypothetical protein WBA51_18630 [Erythrobacter sp.]